MKPPLVLPAAARTVQPWKNGGGATQDIARWPADSTIENFGWRLSIAEVTQDGPFSDFPGIDRHLAVLTGRLLLEGDGVSVSPLDAGSDPVSFPGDKPVFGRMAQSVVRDCNLMVRRDAFTGRLRRIAGNIAVSSATTIILAPAEREILTAGLRIELAPFDALAFERDAHFCTSEPVLIAEINPH